MVFVPDKVEASADDLDLAVSEEERINRLNTAAFISQDPEFLILHRPMVGITATGARTRTSEQVLPEQRFKLIMISPAGGSLGQSSEDGTVMSADYVLLGEWNADVRSGDFWEDENGGQWEVSTLIPTNSYETRANVRARSRKALSGG